MYLCDKLDTRDPLCGRLWVKVRCHGGDVRNNKVVTAGEGAENEATDSGMWETASQWEEEIKNNKIVCPTWGVS